MSVCLSVCLCVCACVCVFVYVYIYVCVSSPNILAMLSYRHDFRGGSQNFGRDVDHATFFFKILASKLLACVEIALGVVCFVY
jgi:hypothetical protein